jgi:hypothetical protein
VFDISVVAAGNEKSGIKYILKPVVGESGPNKSFNVKREDKLAELGVEIVTDANGATVVTVTDEAGVPVAGAEVEIEVTLPALRSDADGRVTFGVPAGTVEVKAEAELGEGEGDIHLVIDEISDEATADEDEDEDGERLTITAIGDLEAGAPLTLLVTNAAGEPAVGADVEVKFEIAAGVTGGEGTLALDVPRTLRWSRRRRGPKTLVVTPSASVAGQTTATTSGVPATVARTTTPMISS